MAQIDSKVFEKFCRLILLRRLSDCLHAYLHSFCSKLNLYDIPFFYIQGCLGNLAIDKHAAGIARLVCHSAPFDQTRHLQELIKSHVFLLAF